MSVRVAAGWTKVRPRRNGWYWWRPSEALSGDAEVIRYLQGEPFSIDSVYALRFEGGEWLGPITPQDFEALHHARQVCEAALEWFDGEMEIGYSEETKSIADQLRQVVQEGK